MGRDGEGWAARFQAKAQTDQLHRGEGNGRHDKTVSLFDLDILTATAGHVRAN